MTIVAVNSLKTKNSGVLFVWNCDLKLQIAESDTFGEITLSVPLRKLPAVEVQRTEENEIDQ